MIDKLRLPMMIITLSHGHIIIIIVVVVVIELLSLPRARKKQDESIETPARVSQRKSYVTL